MLTDRTLIPLWRPGWASETQLLSIVHDARNAGGIAAGGQTSNFGQYIFLRDACRIVRDTMHRMPGMAREILGILPQYQGVEVDPFTGEMPDALPHQLFRQIVGGRLLTTTQVDAAEALAAHWEVPMRRDAHMGKWFAVYNSSDGPLLYLIALAELVKLGHREVLGDWFVHQSTGQLRTVAEAAQRCVSYARTMLRASEERGLGLYAVSNTNAHQTSPSGVMRDGFDAYFRPAGDKALPIRYRYVAYIENQALFYEAMILAAKVLFPGHDEASEWLLEAETVRQRTLDLAWWEQGGSGFFYPAIDSEGPVPLQSSAAVELLDGPFFDGLTDGPEYIRALVRWLYSPDVMTSIGPRMLSLVHAGCEEPYYAYQGSGAVWSVTNGIIARGLRRHGLHWLADDLGIGRLLGWFNLAESAQEFAYVDRATGTPATGPAAVTPEHTTGAIVLAAADIGQPDQVWGASAGLAEIRAMAMGRRPDPKGWHRDLTLEVESRVAPPAALPGADYAPVIIDTEAGRRLKAQRARSLGYRALQGRGAATEQACRVSPGGSDSQKVDLLILMLYSANIMASTITNLITPAVSVTRYARLMTGLFGGVRTPIGRLTS